MIRASFKGSSQSSLELWVAYTAGGNRQIYCGYWDADPSHEFLRYANPVSNATSYYSPALTVDWDRNYLRLAFTGTNNQLNITYSTTGDSWAYNPNTWTSQTSTGGLGFAYYCPPGQSCNPYIAWIGNGNGFLNIGYWNANAGQFVKVQTLNNEPADCYAQLPGADAALVANGSQLFLLFPAGDGIVGDAWSTNASQSSVNWTCELQWNSMLGSVNTYYGVAGGLYGSTFYAAFEGSAEDYGILYQGSFAP